MIEQAASALEVPCESYDITDNSTEIITCWNELDKGLLVLHLHGKLDDTVRYTQDQTPKLTIDQQSLVNDLLIADRLVVIGASLRYDNDATAMLRDMNTPEPGYYFNRSDEDTTPGDHATRTIDTGNLFQNRQWVTDDFDFDTFMLLLVSAYREWAYDTLNGNEYRSQLNLPRLEDILLPDSFVLRTALANISLHGVAILEGPPLVGKTFAGVLLGHCLAICGPGEPCKARSFVGPDHTLGALASDLNATDTASLLLIHPFGEESQLDSNPSLLRNLATRVQEPKGHKLTIIVCCESSKLDTALNQVPSLIDVIALVRLPRKRWFSKDRLTEYARRHGKHDVSDAIKTDEVTNPWAVGAWCHGTMPKLDVRIVRVVTITDVVFCSLFDGFPDRAVA